MPSKKKSRNTGKVRTSMWLSNEVLIASAKRAAKMGVSRGLYIEQLMRKDLGLGALSMAEDEAETPASVFG